MVPKAFRFALFTVGLMSLVGCSQSGAKPKLLYTYGRIVSVDVAARTVVVTERQTGANSNEVVKVERTYKVASDCQISTETKHNAELADLKAGDKVSVRYLREGSEFIAHRIKPHSSEPQPKAPSRD